MLNTDMVTELLREGVWVAVKLCAPLLLLSMAVGVLLAISQAGPNHQSTLSFIFKLTVVILVLLVGGGWMMQTLLDYANELFELMRTI